MIVFKEESKKCFEPRSAILHVYFSSGRNVKKVKMLNINFKNVPGTCPVNRLKNFCSPGLHRKVYMYILLVK